MPEAVERSDSPPASNTDTKMTEGDAGGEEEFMKEESAKGEVAATVVVTDEDVKMDSPQHPLEESVT